MFSLALVPSCPPSLSLLVLSLLLLQSSHLGHSYRRVLVKLSTLLVHKSVSFGSLIFTPSFNLPSHGGLEGPQHLQGEFNFFTSIYVQVDSAS